MLENLNISPEIIKALSTGIVGALITGLFVHFVEKKKYNRLLRDHKRLIQEAEFIKSNFAKELEDVKRDHQLEITRRKYQYEGKKDSYVAFFKMLDTFSTEHNIKAQEKLKEYLDEFNRNFGDTAKSQKNASLIFSKKIQALTMESYKDFIKLKHETNSIKLMASDSVRNELQLFENEYEKLMTVSDALTKAMPTLILSQDSIKMNLMKAEVEKEGLLINFMKEELIRLMREELNQI